MAFIVENGTGIEGANAYLTVEEANEYHKDRGNTAWQGAASQKQVAIVKATQYLEAMYDWTSGDVLKVEQSLSWPRAFATDANGWGIESSEVPDKVKQATAELALRALTAALVADSERFARRTKVGDLEIEYEPGDLRESKRYPMVDGLLKGLALVRGTGKSAGVAFAEVERT